MILLLDAGNSRFKWACAEAGRLGPMQTCEHRPESGYQSLFAAWQGVGDIKAMFVANVLGDIFASELRAWAQKKRVKIEFVSVQQEAYGVTNAYHEPTHLGVDRWLCLIAARELIPGNVCIADCGTAMTIDVMDAGGRHRGGLILPGLTMMRQSLIQGTAGIALDDDHVDAREVSLLARDTREAVIGGTLYAQIAALDRIVADLREVVGAQLACVITGGDAPMLLPLLSDQWRHVPELVLEGLAVITGEDGG